MRKQTKKTQKLPMFHARHGAKLSFDIHSVCIILLCLNNLLPFQITFTTSKCYLCFMIHFKLCLLASAQILNHCIFKCHFPFPFFSWLCHSWVSLLFHGDDARNNTYVLTFKVSLCLPEGRMHTFLYLLLHSLWSLFI